VPNGRGATLRNPTNLATNRAELSISLRRNELTRFSTRPRPGQTCAPHRYCLSWSALICPKFSGDAKLVRFLDQATDIVTNDLTQDFIDHRDISLAPKVISELCIIENVDSTLLRLW